MNYTIDYDKGLTAACPEIYVNDHTLWQSTGNSNTNYETHLDWNANTYNYPSGTYVPLGQSNSTYTALGWYSAPGYQFQTNVQGNGFFGTRYHGYDTLN